MTEPRPRVSILVPTYNRAELLAVCLQHARTAPAWAEIVVADNASTDGTAEMVAELARADGRIRHLRNERNIGMVPNFNRALREARGEYVCLVCDDDLILPGHIEEKAALLDRHPEVGFVYCPWVLIDGEGRSQAVPLGSGMLTYGYVGGRDEFGDLLQNNHIMMNSVLLRKSLLEEHGYMTEEARYAPANDWELWLRLSRRVQTAYLPEPRVCVRFHEASETAKTGSNHTRSAAARLNLWRKYLLEEEPPVVLNENVWERMRALFDQDLNYWFGGDQGTVRPYLDEFDAIRTENRRLAGARVHDVPARQEPRTEVRGWVASGQPSCRTDQTARGVSLPTAACGPIHWHANVFDFSGYARLGRDAIRALDRAGVPQSLTPVGGSPRFLEQLGAEEVRLWRGLQAERRTGGAFVCFGVPALWDGTSWYAHHRAANPGHARYVGVCMFETDGLPAGWAAACDSMDEVWVPSAFNRDTFARAGVPAEKLRVVPFGIEASAYDPECVRPLDIPGRRAFAFLSVFQWTKRKGWDVLLRAYVEAFTAADDVCLVLRAYPERAGGAPIRERVEAYARALGRDPAQAPAILVLDDFVSEADMPALYRAADAFVLPTRGEGWGIPFMEAMASGLPTIATRWSAHLDFMTDENSYLVDVDGLAPVDADQSRENPFYTPDQRWAEPSVAHTSALMRRVFEQRDEALAKGARARRDIVEQWPLERTAQWIADCVRAPSDTNYGGAAEGGASPAPTHGHPASVTNPKSKIENPKSKISWSAPLFDPSGYAEEARAFLLALDRAGHAVAAQHIRWSDRAAVLPAADERRLLRMTARAAQPGGAHVCHILAPHFTRRADARVNIGRTMFETDGLPAEWVAACNRMDRVWVPSEFNRETFARAGVDPPKLAVVPGALDLAAYDPATPPLHIEGARGFNFLAVFDWTLRKGWDVLLRAYCEEFAPDEDVCLILKTHASMGYTTDRMVAQATDFLTRTLGRELDALPDIVFQDTNLPAHRMPALYAAADCFVLPSRGEGWGRPWMEAMATGLPAIGTRWSGNTAFMTDENSLLVDCEVVPVPEEAWRETPTYRGHRWAEPDPAHLRRLMRQVFTDREAGRALGAKARADIAERFSYARVAAIIEEEIARALEAGPPAPAPPAKPRGWLEQEIIARPAADNPMMLEVNGVRGFLNTADIERLFERARALRPGGTLVEIGSFMGLSAIMFANGLLAAGNLSARIHCVDTWEGSPEHQELDVIRQGGLFETFLRNVESAGVADLVVPHRKPSVQAARDFSDGSVDLLFVDGDHSHEGCYADLAAWYPRLAPGGTLIGHDCAPESGVRSAVEQFARERGLELLIAGPPVNYLFELRAAKPAIAVMA